MIVLKYLSWILTVGTAFVGSWFLEYTTTDRDTGRKKLTVWGRRGILFAGLALACSLVLTLWTDHEAALKAKRATEEAERERAVAAEHQGNLKTALADIKSLMTTISATSLSGKDKAAINQTVKTLAGIDDYRKYYPDLYDRLMEATSFDETSSAIKEGLYRGVAGRISDEPGCSHLPKPSREMTAGFPAGHFRLGGLGAINYMITPDYIEFEFSDVSDVNSLSGGKYMFAFADGSQSRDLHCKSPSTVMSCVQRTSDVQARAVYVELQKNLIVAVKTETKTYEVSKSTAEALRRTFSCLSP